MILPPLVFPGGYRCSYLKGGCTFLQEMPGGLVVYEALVAGGAVDDGFMSDQEALTCNPASFMFRMFLDSLKFIIFMQLGFSSNGTSFGRLTNSLVA